MRMHTSINILIGEYATNVYVHVNVWECFWNHLILTVSAVACQDTIIMRSNETSTLTLPAPHISGMSSEHYQMTFAVPLGFL